MKQRSIAALTCLFLALCLSPSISAPTSSTPSSFLATEEVYSFHQEPAKPLNPELLEDTEVKNFHPVPEPSVVFLIGLGIAAALTFFRRRRRYHY